MMKNGKPITWLTPTLFLSLVVLGLSYVVISSFASFLDIGEVFSFKLAHLVLFEVVVIIAIILVLIKQDIKFDPVRLRSILEGVLLFLACNVALKIVFLIFGFIFTSNNSSDFFEITSNDSVLFYCFLIISPLYEELMVLFLPLNQFKKRPYLGLTLSVGLRVVYHIHQGLNGVITNMTVGIVYGFFYQKRKNIWPVVLAHVLYNISYFYLNK